MTSPSGLFSTFHLASLCGVICPVTPRVVTANNPCERFSGVFPRTSIGCDGTIPTLPFEPRIHTPVTGCHLPRPGPPRVPRGLHTQPTPGWFCPPPQWYGRPPPPKKVLAKTPQQKKGSYSPEP